MSWEKIEDHLFDKYCVEGRDDELVQLMEAHDQEIREQVVGEFLKKMEDFLHKEDICYYKEDIQNIAKEVLQKHLVMEKEEFDEDDVWDRFHNQEPLTKDEYLYIVRDFNPNFDGPITLFRLERDYKEYMESIQSNELEK